MSEATDVLRAIDQLRRDLSGYHGQLKAHNDLQAHCDRQRERIAQLEGLYAGVKAENEKLRELASKLGILADSGLMALDDKEFASIIDNAKELGVELWTSSSACSASTSTSSSATSTATRLTT